MLGYMHRPPRTYSVVELEHLFRSFVDREVFPWGKLEAEEGGILEFEPRVLPAFEWFMARYTERHVRQDPWQILKWDPQGGQLDAMHVWLFDSITKDSIKAKWRHRYCVIVSPLFSRKDFDLNNLIDFQRKNLSSGFKRLLCLKKPANYLWAQAPACSGACFGDLFFVVPLRHPVSVIEPCTGE